jgi:hypothetical protein
MLWLPLTAFSMMVTLMGMAFSVVSMTLDPQFGRIFGLVGLAMIMAGLLGMVTSRSIRELQRRIEELERRLPTPPPLTPSSDNTSN